MQYSYKTGKGDDSYFVTITVVDWLSVLLDDENKMGHTLERVAKARKQSNKLCRNEMGVGCNSFIFVKVIGYARVMHMRKRWVKVRLC